MRYPPLAGVTQHMHAYEHVGDEIHIPADGFMTDRRWRFWVVLYIIMRSKDVFI